MTRRGGSELRVRGLWRLPDRLLMVGLSLSVSLSRGSGYWVGLGGAVPRVAAPWLGWGRRRFLEGLGQKSMRVS